MKMISPFSENSQAPVAPNTPKLPYMTGFEHFMISTKERIQVLNPGKDYKEIFKKCAEIWNMLAPCEKMYWENRASIEWHKYTRDVLELVYRNPQHSMRMPQGCAVHCSTVKGATAQDYGSKVAMPHSHWIHYYVNRDFTGYGSQGAKVAQSYRGQGATAAQGYGTHGATAAAQSNGSQGATAAQDYGSQGATAAPSYGSQGATGAQDYGSQGATAAQDYDSQGATEAQGYRSQGATAAQSYGSQGVTGAQGYGRQGATAAQDYSSQGSTAAQSYKSQGATAAQSYGSHGATVIQSIRSQGATVGQCYGSQGPTAAQSYGSQDATTAQDYGSQGGTATQDYGSQGSTATQDYGSQGGTAAQGYGSQRATAAQSYWSLGTTEAQGNGGQGAIAAQDSRGQNEAGMAGFFYSGGRIYPAFYADMDAGTSYKSYLYCGDDPKPEVRRFYLNHLESYKFAPLQAILRDIYNLKSLKFTIAWKDEDGDEVIISSDGEVAIMFSEIQGNVIKLVVRCDKDARAQKIPETKVIPGVAATTTATLQGGMPEGLHRGVTCDVCGVAVVGHRYKCISCDNFDLCAKCEAAGRHPEHCVVRVPPFNMSVPLLKATIKKSRRFLKSMTSNVIEENKKQRRERNHSAEHNTRAKPDPQPRAFSSWIDVFSKYMDEFANMSYFPENQTTEAATATEPRSDEAEVNIPTDDQIAQNPWQLAAVDLARLQRACEYMRGNIGATTSRAANIFASLNPGVNAPEEDSNKAAANQTQVEKVDNAEAGPAPRQEAMNPEIPEPQESPKSSQDFGQPKLAPTQAAMSDAPKMAQTAGQGTPDSATLTDKQGCLNKSQAELVDAINKCELYSNESSSSEGSGYEKVEGWTVVDAENIMKDTNRDAWANKELEPMEPIRKQAAIYPELNVATAVLNPNESVTVPTAPIPIPEKIEQPVKKAASVAEDLNMQIAPHVDAALQQMLAMGFSNESGWLTQLLDHHNGNIAIVLDLIAPVKDTNTPNIPK